MLEYSQKNIVKISHTGSVFDIHSTKYFRVGNTHMSDTKDNNMKVVFSDTDTRHAQLKIRLKYDGISQAEFFRSFITGYLENDKSIVDFIKRYKEATKKMSKRNLKYVKKDNDMAEDLLSKFGIGDEEIENIFDIIAKSHPEL